METLLERIKSPQDIKSLSQDELFRLAEELRALIIKTVAENGGHLASNLGVIELTLTLLKVFDFTRDQIVFDVGHQAYAWKILTGRLEQFCTLRKMDGLSGFPKQSESCYDFFNTGHSSTSISAALGLSRAMSHSGRAGQAIAVIGDGALTGGMAFEALNDAGQSGENLIVILNDNQMSISPNVGGLSRHLENLRVSKHYLRFKARVEPALRRLPIFGRPLYHLMLWFKKMTRTALQQRGILFEQLGFRYYGPIDGHDMDDLIEHMQAIRSIKGPVLLHVLTQKGKGYSYAEASPDLYHGVAPFVIENGVVNGHTQVAGKPTFSEIFGQTLAKAAAHQPHLCAISAAMTAGTGLTPFAKTFPARFYDVGIAEQHAMTLAAGLASGGMKPVIALYSTFLQRAYDQLLHDVCLQCLPVVLAVDRAGIVGEDGETHQGIYDLSLLLPLPGLEIFCPADYRQLEAYLAYALSKMDGPVAIRYPRGREWPEKLPDQQPLVLYDAEDPLLPIQRASLLRNGKDLTIVALGTMAGPALSAAKLLEKQKISAQVLSYTCVKPFDKQALIQAAKQTAHILFVEETLCEGGFAQSVLPFLMQTLPGTAFDCLGVKDQPLCQGSRDQLLQLNRLQPDSIASAAADLLGK